MKFSSVLLPAMMLASPAFARPTSNSTQVSNRSTTTSTLTSLKATPTDLSRTPTFRQSSDPILISVVPRSPEPKGSGGSGNNEVDELMTQIDQQLTQIGCDKLDQNVVGKIKSLNVDSLRTLGTDVGLPISIPSSDIAEIKKMGAIAQGEIVYQVKDFLLSSIDEKCGTGHSSTLGQSPIQQVITKACSGPYAKQFREAINDGNLQQAILILNSISGIDQNIKDGAKQILEVLDKSGVFFGLTKEQFSESMDYRFGESCPKESGNITSGGVNVKIPKSMIALAMLATLVYGMA